MRELFYNNNPKNIGAVIVTGYVVTTLWKIDLFYNLAFHTYRHLSQFNHVICSHMYILNFPSPNASKIFQSCL